MRLSGTGWHAAPNDLYDGSLNHFEAAVLGYLYRRAGPDGASWPSVNRIAKHLKMGPTTVRLILKSLEVAGRLTRIERSGGTTIYRVGDELPPRVAMPSPSPHDALPPRVAMPKYHYTEVPLTEVNPPVVPPKGGARDIGLHVLKTTTPPDPRRQQAQELVNLCAGRFGWPRTKTRMAREVPMAFELLEAGIPYDFLVEQVNKLNRLGSMEFLHRLLDLRDLQGRDYEHETEQIIRNLRERREQERARGANI